MTAFCQPRLDIFEDEEKILLVMDLPGVKAEEVIAEASPNLLCIRGEIPAGSQMPLSYRERTPGSFYRKIPLPPLLDLDRAEASCRDGLLKITIPKKKASQERVIQIKH
ncbi:MAG: Hsp20/alpha crystallin family protein [Thermacetogeniaceae bacterium]